MLYIFLSSLSGIFSGMISIYFRKRELKQKIILLHKQFFLQVAIFIAFAFVFRQFFSSIQIDLGFIKFGWLMIFVIFSSFTYYVVQVFYEFFSGNKLFATEQEMQDYMKKIEDEHNDF